MANEPADFSGSWQADFGRSHFITPKPRALAMTIRHAGAVLQVQALVTGEDGQPQNNDFSCRTDGSTGAMTLNGQPVEGKCFWSGTELVFESRQPAGGAMVDIRDYWTLIDGGAAIKMEHRDDVLKGQVIVMARR